MDISVIIPTYNVENYIEEALTSIIQQTFRGKVEIIAIDDCSSDQTPQLLEEFRLKHPDTPMTIIYQKINSKQGAARNRGLEIAKGKYIFFLDGDDFLDKSAFEKMFRKAEDEQCDFVVCDWVYYIEDKGLVYVNNDKFMFQDKLENEECDMLMSAATYFSVNKLYSRSFIMKNNIKYGEGYIYEDYEFYVETANKANKIGIVNNPYYRVRSHANSTTKTNKNTTIHVDSLVIAVEKTLSKFEPRLDASTYYLYKYIIKKTFSYIRHRAPMGTKKKTIERVVALLNNKSHDYYVPKRILPLYHYCFKKRYVQDGKILRLMILETLEGRGYLRPLFAKALRTKENILKIRFVSKFLDKRKKKQQIKLAKRYERLPIRQNVILFLGFDYRYTGNSRYLFEYCIANNPNDINYYFVTNDKRVPYKYRIEPRSAKFQKQISIASVVLAESWVPLDFKKKENQKWIQLWHGTPFKKLFFDSSEPFISRFNRNHKRNKQRDIAKWDYILADSKIGLEKLSSAFAVDEEVLLPYGYPRVEWLKSNRNNEKLKEEIRNKLGIPSGKKVLLYVPTWRDYNFRKKQEELDLAYHLDLESVSEELKEEYVILNQQHSMTRFETNDSLVITPPAGTETQELILIADVIVSDYSSIIFDGMAIDIPFYLYITDFDKYEKARGVYEDMHKQLSPFYVDNKDDLVNNINGITNVYPQQDFDHCKELYSYTWEQSACACLKEKIEDIANN